MENCFFTTGASVVTSATDLQKRFLGTKRSAECPQDARSVVETALKCLKAGQGDVQGGLTQMEAEKQGSAPSQISCGNKGIFCSIDYINIFYSVTVRLVEPGC